MLTSKQRAMLRGLANTEDTILTVGHQGIIEMVVKEADLALTARELIKGRVLPNAPVTAREAAGELAQAIGADVVQVIGSRFVLYRRNPKKPKIQLVPGK